MVAIQKPRGTQDIYGAEMKYWLFIEQQVRTISELYQFKQIRTPMFEKIELFARGVGQTSDIVSKEMYDFYDKGKRHLALKPESTAAVVRSFIENKLYAEGDYHKYYYLSPHFRYERAQTGRYRQHHQFGVEVFGDKNPYIDAEIMLFAVTVLKQIGLKDFTVKINSLGDTETRVAYRQALQDHFRPHLADLCQDCNQRFDKNPLRILDCKVDNTHPAMINAPILLDYLTKEAKTYFDNLIALLAEFDVEYEIDNRLVRGLDYYTHTVFEIVLDDPTSAKAGSLCGGGRYDGLVAEFEGPEKSGMGFGMGLERLIIALKEQEIILPENKKTRVYVANLDGDQTQKYAASIVQTLREQGINVETNYLKKSMKAIFKLVDRYKATHLLIVGANELAQQSFELKDLNKREQKTYPLTALTDANTIFE